MLQSYGSNCEASCVVSCPSGWEREGDKCYFWSKTTKDWEQAEEFCLEQGGHLASVNSQEVFKYTLSKGERVWIGGRNENQEKNKWVWSTELKFVAGAMTV